MDNQDKLPSCASFLHLARIFHLVSELLATQLRNWLVLVGHGIILLAGLRGFVKHASDSKFLLLQLLSCAHRLQHEQREQHDTDTDPNWPDHQRWSSDEAADGSFGGYTCSHTPVVSGMVMGWSLYGNADDVICFDGLTKRSMGTALSEHGSRSHWEGASARGGLVRANF